MTETSPNTVPAAPAITFFGADWCSDCRRSKALLDSLNVGYAYNDVEHDAAATEEAHAISGGTHIPVIRFADGAVQVEPSDADLKAKLVELGIVAGA